MENLYPKVSFTSDEVVSIRDSNGNSTEMVEYDGYYLSRNAIENGDIPDPRTNIPNVIKMKVRPDDVFICAYPKAGTHWTSEIMYMLLHGKVQYNQEPQIKSMLPFHTPEVLDKLSSPRIINSHMYFRHLPDDILSKQNKIVFVSRNPKDIAVAYYHHCQNVSLQYKGSWDDFLKFFMADKACMYHSPWYLYMLNWERVLKEQTGLDVLEVKYEDLSKNPIKEIERIARFLNVPNTTTFYESVAEKCSFQNLKTDYIRRDKGGILFRKGKVSSWKDWFTVTQNEQFDKYLEDKLKGSDFKFIYSI